MFRAATAVGRTALRRLPAASSRRRPTNLLLQRQRTGRRHYHMRDDGIPQNDFTPAEEIIMDSTAWFVAFAICWTPEHHYADDLDIQDLDDMEDEAESHSHPRRRRNNKKPSPKIDATPAVSDIQADQQHHNGKDEKNDKERDHAHDDHHRNH